MFPHYGIGHFIGEPDNPTEFELTRFENMGELPDIEDPHKHTFYEILWTDAGRSSQVIDYQEFDVEPGTLFFISPGQLHHFEEYQPLRGGSVFFTEDYFLRHQPDRTLLFQMTFLDNFFGNPLLRPTPEDWRDIRQTIDELERERYRADSDERIVRSLLHILLARVQRSYQRANGKTVSSRYLILFKEFQRLLNQQYDAGWTAGQYAEALLVTQHHLNLICRQLTGRTTSQLIRARSILEARRLLTFSEQRISEIAAALGYYDLSYFGKIFRAETGCSPKQFRREVSEKYRNL